MTNYTRKFITQVRAWDRKTKDFQTRRVVIEIDEQALADWIGPKAFRNKQGTSKLQGGLIKATAK